jgi:hypothetical protein
MKRETGWLLRFVWFVSFIWLSQTNQINQIDQINQMNLSVFRLCCGEVPEL